MKHKILSGMVLMCIIVLTSCTSKTEKELNGYWVSEKYECDDLMIYTEDDILEIFAQEFTQFEDGKISRNIIYSIANENFAMVSISGKYSVYKDKGINVNFNISTLNVKSIGTDTPTDIISGLRKSVIESLGNLNSVTEGKRSEEYNVGIVSFNPEKNSSLILSWLTTTVEYKRTNKSHYASDLMHFQLHPSSTASSNSDNEGDAEVGNTSSDNNFENLTEGWDEVYSCTFKDNNKDFYLALQPETGSGYYLAPSGNVYELTVEDENSNRTEFHCSVTQLDGSPTKMKFDIWYPTPESISGVMLGTDGVSKYEFFGSPKL